MIYHYKKNAFQRSYKLFLGLCLLFLLHISCVSNKDMMDTQKQENPNPELNLTKTVPMGPNSWVVGDLKADQAIVSDAGIQNWTSLEKIIRTYIKTSAGTLEIGLKIKAPTGPSKIKVTLGKESKIITISDAEYTTIPVGVFQVDAGYKYLEIQGIEKTGDRVAVISNLLLGGSALKTLTFVPANNPYFGRRGPSVHMAYMMPKDNDVEWFYNEVTVPEGEDQIGSFFMANGHAQGYFGMQVNSPTERRVLFSIWSPYDTDHPNQVPDDYQVTRLSSGEGVLVKDFGNEGTGKQSIKRVNWKAGVTYKFLLRGAPADVSGFTDYTGYFYDPEVGKWELIASLRRPKTSTYLGRLHSFLENFTPSAGYLSRSVLFGNQWVYTTDKQWIEITKATFTADATASKGDRLDYAGGVRGQSFFLKNCGFFNDNVPRNTPFERPSSGKTPPEIDFSAL